MSTQSDEDSNENTGDCENNTCFGEFLTNQYELLKRTLWFLSIEDSKRAALVCRSWRQTVALIRKERDLQNKIRWHLQCVRSQCDYLNCYKDNLRFRSQVILGFQLTNIKNMKLMEEISYDKNSLEGKKMIFPGLEGHAFLINTDKLDVPVRLSNNVFKYAKRRNAAMLFPHSNRFKISCALYANESSLNHITESDYGPLQGLLIFADDFRESFVSVYNNLCHSYRRPIPLAGGLFPSIKHQDSGKWRSTKHVLVLGFHGDINCYSDILSDTKKSAIEPFMKKMRNNLGDTDLQTQQRIAIVIRCCSRPFATYEHDMFQKYFPDIPAFVLVSYGEYGNRADSTEEKKAKILARSGIEIRYAYSTVYFIITIPLPPNTPNVLTIPTPSST